LGTVTGRKHAPALAFAVLGWSLISPPPLQNSWWSAYWPWSARDRWDLAAPLSQWITRDTFGTLESCRSALAMMRQENATYLASSIDAWQCVAAEDAHTEVTSASDD
jgi:hypothetical protein